MKVKPKAPRIIVTQKSLENKAGQTRFPTDLPTVLAGEGALVDVVATCADVGLLIEAPDAETDADEPEAEAEEIGPTPQCSAKSSRPTACAGSNDCTQFAQVVIAGKPTDMKKEHSHAVELQFSDWMYAVKVVEH